MDRETRELLIKINAKKEECKILAKADKLEEAKAAKQELIDLQAKFDVLYDLDAEVQEELKNNIGNKKIISGNEKQKPLDNKLISNAIYPCEKMNFRSKNTIGLDDNLDLGKLIKGMAGKGWEDSIKEQTYFRNSMSAGGTKVVIPTPLSESILDLARSQSAILGNIPIIPMENNNISVVVQNKDAEACFVAEEEEITESEAVFGSTKLYGKTIAILIPLTEQLLDSTSNLKEQLENSCARAIASSLDKALLYGTGNGTEEAKEIKGLSAYSEINNVTHEGTLDYDFILKGIGAVKGNNIEPTNIAFNTTVGTNLSLAKDSIGQYIAPPVMLANYITTQSNNIKDKEALIFDKDSLVIGINKDITIEYGHYNNTFKKLMKGLRIHMRVDLGVLRPKGIAISKVTP